MTPRSKKTRFERTPATTPGETMSRSAATPPLTDGTEGTDTPTKGALVPGLHYGGPPGASGRSPHIPFTGGELRERLRQYDRQPFLELLAGWLECAPSAEAIKAFAERSPDKYAMAMGQVARIAGYSEKTEVTNNVHVTVGKMSDSQLEDRLREMQEKLGLSLIVDAEFVDVSGPVGEVASSGEKTAESVPGEDS